ncbi:hypothetical protein FOL47_002133 [Perkinsus chesapeaki]|uniref:Uncharacterized protein n=1 Tax=Perkinsus chesapeaki TaxID=330153 RepID=A0A7J6MGU1_PERCH|nr:hypothetical protein FOL47_002133 [Perkinsus chesapeaki]
MTKLLQLLSLVIVVLVIPGYAQNHTFKGVYTTKASALTVEITYDESKPQTMVVYLEDSKDKHTFNVKARKNPHHKDKYKLEWEPADHKLMVPFLKRLEEKYRIAMHVVVFADKWAQASLYMFAKKGGPPPLPFVLKPVS